MVWGVAFFVVGLIILGIVQSSRKKKAGFSNSLIIRNDHFLDKFEKNCFLISKAIETNVLENIQFSDLNFFVDMLLYFEEGDEEYFKTQQVKLSFDEYIDANVSIDGILSSFTEAQKERFYVAKQKVNWKNIKPELETQFNQIVLENIDERKAEEKLKEEKRFQQSGGFTLCAACIHRTSCQKGDTCMYSRNF